uniref:Ferrochelatase n=1 Tax=Rhodosorus marinus TaxID=101924 RepID=A0A7S2ZRP6_9RHOD|mmetsp:Transcript_27729/g.108751  ORF Transcript_27729/g.108751 Transcript_27729/m.108751 type:complete len:129 (+) Transcript_27729:925-1311(+)
MVYSSQFRGYNVFFACFRYNRDGYKQAMASLISKSIAELTDEQKSSMTVMFSAHGVPESYIEAGDPYQKQIQECCKGVMELVGSEVSWTLCYQSRVGPVKWLSPYTDEVLSRFRGSHIWFSEMIVSSS